MDIGTGIVTGSALLGGVQIMLRFALNNKSKGFITEKVCDSRFELISNGIDGLRSDIQGLHKRIDSVLNK
jgi:hypothetical protein